MDIFIGFIPPILFMPEFIMPEFIPPKLPIPPMLPIEFIPTIPMFMGVVEEVLARISLLDFMPIPIAPAILMPIPPPPMFMFIPS
jgi:hypothetical protein